MTRYNDAEEATRATAREIRALYNWVLDCPVDADAYLETAYTDHLELLAQLATKARNTRFHDVASRYYSQELPLEEEEDWEGFDSAFGL